jgi:hypothetical protein
MKEYIEEAVVLENNTFHYTTYGKPQVVVFMQNNSKSEGEK